MLYRIDQSAISSDDVGLTATGASTLSLSWLDLMVLAVYVLAVVGSGLLFKDRFSNARDYFAAGGGMAWWIAGFSAITSELSVFAFTASAGKYAQQGVMLLYVNLLSIATLPLLYWLGPRYRRLQVTTGMEAVRLRFGKGTEKLYSGLLIPLGIWGGAMGIHITATFLSSASGITPDSVVLVVGGFTVAMSVLGGVWAVATSDLFQGGLSLLMMVVLLVYASMSPGVEQAGGLVQSIPTRLTDVFEGASPPTFIMWALAMTLVTVLSRLSLIHDGSKFLVARSERDCRLMVSVIIVVSLTLAPLLALPAMISSSVLGPEVSASAITLPEGIMCRVARHVLPTGLFGLLLAGVMAAAMNSMDNGLNRNAGYFVTSVYLRYIRPEAASWEIIRVSRLATLVSGGSSVGVAVLLNHWRDIGLFDFVLRSNALIAIPLMVPLAMGLLIRQAPGWSGWSGMLVCTLVSWGCGMWVEAGPVLQWLGVAVPSVQETLDARLAIQILATVLTGAVWCVLSSLIARGAACRNAERASAERVDFWNRWETKVPDQPPSEGLFQYRNAGIVLLVFGLGLGCLGPFFRVPNEGAVVIGLAAVFVGAGYFLFRKGTDSNTKEG